MRKIIAGLIAAALCAGVAHAASKDDKAKAEQQSTKQKQKAALDAKKKQNPSGTQTSGSTHK